MPVHLAVPPGAGRWPGVVVLHDALGMSTDVRAQADWLAGEGFLAIAPDLYHFGRRFRCFRQVIRDAARGDGATFADIEAARRWLAGDERCSGAVGVIGFCMGGGFAVLLAPTGRYAAASVNYGGIPRDLEEFLAESCPIVASYGGRDPTLRTAPVRLEEALTCLGVEHDVVIHPEAGHGFMNDHRLDRVPVAVRVLGWLSRTAYHPEAAAEARHRVVTFFRTHLSVPPA